MVVAQQTKVILPFLNKSNIENNIETLNKYVQDKLKKEHGKNSTLKDTYFNFIKLVQDVEVPYSNEKIFISFYNKPLQEKLLALKMIDSEDLEKNQHIYPDAEQNLINHNMSKALELIKLLHPELYVLIHNLVGTFLVLKKEGFGGGSVSNILGLIWINPQQNWTIIDYAEAIYHEFIHQSIFLDDMVNCMFPDPNACAAEDALVTSTILKRKRPLDRSFHAAGVSLGVMHLYYLLNDKEKSIQYLNDLKITLDEISTKTKFLGERGIETLELMKKFINKPNFDDITYSLKN